MLNKEQLEVLNEEDSLVNIAGPGSGKTHTLTEKIKKIKYKYDYEELLVLTFTNSAAKEISNRCMVKKPKHFGTYHGIFLKILRDKDYLTRYFQIMPTIISPNEIIRFVKNQVKGELDENYKELVNLMIENEKVDSGKEKVKSTNTLIDKHLFDIKHIMSMLDTEINLMKVKEIGGIENVKELYINVFKRVINKILEELNLNIDSKKTRQTDVFSKTVNTGLVDKEINKHEIIELVKFVFHKLLNLKIEQKMITFSDILLLSLYILDKEDEFRIELQDFFKYIFVDEFQDTNVIQNEILLLLLGNKNKICVIGDPYQSIFGFIGATINNILNAKNSFKAKMIQLLVNYRSNQNIVDLTNYLGENMIEKVDGWKPCKSGNTEIINNPIYYKYNSFYSEGDILKSILNVPLNKTIGIIQRSGHTAILEKELVKNGLKYNKLGGLTLKETPEVQTLIHLFLYIFNEDKFVSFIKVLENCVGVGATAIDRIHSAYNKKEEIKYTKKIQELLNKINKIREENIILKSTKEKLFDFYKKEIVPKISGQWKEKRYEEYKDRISVLETEIYDLDSITSISNFFDEYMLLDDKGKKEETERITITTIHSAKGLEWDYVFLNVWDDKSFERDNLPEGQRLNYVSVSRPKEKLFIFSRTEKIYGIDRDFVLNSGIFEPVDNSFKDIEEETFVEEDLVIRFGKHKGKKFNELSPNYLGWLYDNKEDLKMKKLLKPNEINYIESLIGF